jgi:integrase
MRTWVYQIQRQVNKLGADNASWYVGWLDPDGRRCSKSFGPGKVGHRAAEKFKLKTHIELIEDRYRSPKNTTWAEFREEFERKIADRMLPQTRSLVLEVLDHFERLVNPRSVASIKTQTIDDYKAKRRVERGQKKGCLVSPATVNRDVRILRAVLRKAQKWGYLVQLPDFQFEREPEKLPTYITPEHFVLLYKACDTAKLPQSLPYPAGDWWKALLVTAYMTGWRIGALLALRWADVDLDASFIMSRAEDNKGKRDQKVPVHAIVVEHLRGLKSFRPTVFPWLKVVGNRTMQANRRTLFDEFARIQKAAGVKPEWRKERYGFHDFRRAFATMNAANMTGDALQHLMQHRDYQTTRRYINIARQLNPTVEKLYVPDVPTKQAAQRS